MKEVAMYQILCIILCCGLLALGIISQKPTTQIIYKEIPKIVEKEYPKCSDCICLDRPITEAKKDYYCNEPSKYACNSVNRVGNVSMSSINIKCSDGRIKVWNCKTNNWQK